MRVLVVLAAACVALLASNTARAHIASAQGSAEHRLTVRISHDRGVIRSVDRQAVQQGSWLFLPNQLWRIRDWHERDLAQAELALKRLWLVRAFTCIHRFEGSWTDPDAPYYGGLQMDVQFQRTYGLWAYLRWGTADHWPPSVQMDVAINAYYSGRGFYPWPNTARYCGLL